MSEKYPILPNNFETESNLAADDPENALSASENAENDAVSASSKSPLRVGEGPGEGSVGASGARPGAEGSVGAHSDAPSPAPKKKKRGPKTPEGKKAVSRNAVKHGLRTPHPFIIEGLESPEEWEQFKLGIIESWQPLGVQELELAVNIAFGHWKLRRCRLTENSVLSKQVEETEWELQQEDALEDDLPDDAPRPRIDPERLIHNQQLKLIPDGWSMDRMLRYEAFVRKALAQDMRELEVHQARRHGIPTPLARVVFNSDPSGAKIRTTANDIPEFQIAKQRVRLAEIGLAERKLAARNRSDTGVPGYLAKEE